ncbi:hypothetical protein SUGI_0255280 [Cryptomeria japonica]|nr:hypothetical protein SUGI_0255280 [Cryptomeria japonica]
MALAYEEYFCHELQGTKIARVSVKGEDGSMVEAATICHKDTSAWNPKHVAFRVLNVKPSAASVCHFIPENHFAWPTRIQLGSTPRCFLALSIYT